LFRSPARVSAIPRPDDGVRSSAEATFSGVRTPARPDSINAAALTRPRFMQPPNTRFALAHCGRAREDTSADADQRSDWPTGAVGVQLDERARGVESATATRAACIDRFASTKAPTSVVFDRRSHNHSLSGDPGAWRPDSSLPSALRPSTV